jgi:RNA polymerase sigma-70 factor, ECF subfamily
MSNNKIQIVEDDLVSLLKNKDLRGFSILYDNYSAAIYGIVFKIVPSEEVANDVLKATFLKIWSEIQNYDKSKGSLFTWLLKVGRSLAIDQLRTKGLQNSIKNTDNVQLDINSEGAKKLIENLLPEQRILIESLYFQGLTLSEVSVKYGISEDTLQARVRVAVMDLRRFMD